jgi:hypothetical protein
VGAPANDDKCSPLIAQYLELSKCNKDGPQAALKDSPVVPMPGHTPDQTTAHSQLRWPNLAPAQGSYYHKVTSAYGTFIGISAEIKLGEPGEDPKRMSGPLKKSLDGFSAYLGGNVFGKHEVDAGMTWSITKDAHGNKDYQHKAWRPFWRDASWGNAPAESRYYWKPGDTVKMTLTEAGPDKLQLSISDVGPNPKRSFTKIFAANGFDPQVLASFKRVDSIDQVHREGKSVLPTKATLLGVNWFNTEMLSEDSSGHKLMTPLDAAHRKVIEPLPYHVFALASDQEKRLGGERVDIYGSRPAAIK